MKESSDSETLITVGTWFQIWKEAEEKALNVIDLLGSLKMTDMKLMDQYARHEIAGHEDVGHENA